MFASGAKWLPRVITTVRGSQSYDITLVDGRITIVMSYPHCLDIWLWCDFCLVFKLHCILWVQGLNYLVFNVSPS